MDLLPFDEYVRSLPRRRMAAGVLFHDSSGRVLLVEPSYKQHWDIPGGVVDAGEAPWTTARREVREEIGLDRRLGQLLVIDNISDDGRMPEGLAFVWDGGLITDADVAALTLTDPEITSVGLHTMQQTIGKVTPSLAARIDAALHASQTGELTLCEDGKSING
ncbi:NUDIX domain-containing protein [Prauserella rugosa]|uniref:NUDIX domain-containing protein n=1 Tax=Prauserella rugosa TaxID=43354 RepID=A0A660CH61_9PSEU|nr:NUDIX hydrolase [Prauserella rugosa]KMS82764.1 NUDIX hydrolase [Streptomyces regensis]TWH20371.1 NUDIX domain-containing protein [Prauserella rugosa]